MNAPQCQHPNAAPVQYPGRNGTMAVQLLLGTLHYCPDCGAEFPRATAEDWAAIRANEVGLPFPFDQ